MVGSEGFEAFLFRGPYILVNVYYLYKLQIIWCVLITLHCRKIHTCYYHCSSELHLCILYYSSVTAFVKPILPMVKNHMMNSSNILRTRTPWIVRIIFTLNWLKRRCKEDGIGYLWLERHSCPSLETISLNYWIGKRAREDTERSGETLNINWSEITNHSEGEILYL